MNVPWTLRFALAWAAIRHEFISISVDSHRSHGVHYRFDLRPQSVRRWIARREQLNAKLQRARDEERERVVKLIRESAGDALAGGVILDGNTAVARIWEQLEKLSPLK